MPDVKIKGYSGNELEYKNVPKVYLAAPESTPDNPVLVPFTYGEAIEGVEVEPDFSSGDMQITAPDGYLIRSGVVKKPETLVPENIAKDVEVAGIVGEFEGGSVETETVTIPANFSEGNMLIYPSEGKYLENVTVEKPETLIPDNVAMGVTIAGIVGALAGSSEVKSASGQTSTTQTKNFSLTHNLGVVPDIFILRYSTVSASRLMFAVGISKKLANKAGASFALKYAITTASNNLMQINQSDYGIEESYGGPVYSANEETIQVSATSSEQVYRYTKWFAIGGLA